jgi:hypothetical protein
MKLPWGFKMFRNAIVYIHAYEFDYQFLLLPLFITKRRHLPFEIKSKPRLFRRGFDFGVAASVSRLRESPSLLTP